MLQAGAIRHEPRKGSSLRGLWVEESRMASNARNNEDLV
jgi:hypothetical protein